MANQQRRTLQHTHTSLAADEVLTAAKRFFTQRHGIYSAFLEKEGPTFVSLRGQGGEEVLIGVAVDDSGTQVTGSSYLFDQQIARFLTTLPPFPTEDATTGPDDEGRSVDDAPRSDDAPPAGAASGIGGAK